jgi:hypothetical protein
VDEVEEGECDDIFCEGEYVDEDVSIVVVYDDEDDADEEG